MNDFNTQSEADKQKLITFLIGAQEFCVDVMSVREIRCWTPATPIPHAPSYVRGIINLRGAVLPIIDLSQRLGFAETEPTSRSVIIVVQMGANLMGLLVDAVTEIHAASVESIQPPPQVSESGVGKYVDAILVTEGRLISRIVLETVSPAEAMALAA